MRENNTETDFTNWYENVNWINLAQESAECWVHIDVVTN